MIRLEHINVFVEDIQKSITFYKAAFPEWKIRDSGKGTWAGKPRNWLHFGNESTYLAFSDRADSPARDITSRQAGLAHFAFEISNIKALTDRMAVAGFNPHSQGNNNPFRQNIYFIDPDGLEVEFVEYFSDLHSERNSTI